MFAGEHSPSYTHVLYHVGMTTLFVVAVFAAPCTGGGESVPAFQTAAEEFKNLPPTLPPEKFAGRQRLGYQAVKEIPRTTAQLSRWFSSYEVISFTL